MAKRIAFGGPYFNGFPFLPIVNNIETTDGGVNFQQCCEIYWRYRKFSLSAAHIRMDLGTRHMVIPKGGGQYYWDGSWDSHIWASDVVFQTWDGKEASFLERYKSSMSEPAATELDIVTSNNWPFPGVGFPTPADLGASPPNFGGEGFTMGISLGNPYWSPITGLYYPSFYMDGVWDSGPTSFAWPYGIRVRWGFGRYAGPTAYGSGNCSSTVTVNLKGNEFSGTLPIVIPMSFSSLVWDYDYPRDEAGNPTMPPHGTDWFWFWKQQGEGMVEDEDACPFKVSSLELSDLVIEPVEWWPFAGKDNNPIWNTTTGALLAGRDPLKS